LNRLIVQGSAAEIERIEGYLRIIDKDTSITSVETYGTSRVIELLHTKASEVAAAIREAYADRVTGSTGGRGGVASQGSPEQVRAEAIAAKLAEARARESGKKASSKQPAGRPEADLEPKMTIAVHEPSNSLIVTAPEQLFQEVEQLAKEIDSRGEQTVEVVVPVNGAAMESMLRQVFLGEAPSSRSTARLPSPARPTPYPRTASPSPATQQRSKYGR
jgi:type II secretory pathway component GspD/PulD (secretin)